MKVTAIYCRHKIQGLIFNHTIWLPYNLSYKLRCLTRISSPEKNWNCACVNNDNFLRLLNIANQLLICNSPFAPLLLVKAYAVYITKKNDIWLLADMEFLSPCSTRREIPYRLTLLYFSQRKVNFIYCR